MMESVIKKIKNLVKKKYIFFTPNCTTAIYLSLKSLNIKKKKNYCTSKYLLRSSFEYNIIR